jgi:hypothetical protein
MVGVPDASILAVRAGITVSDAGLAVQDMYESVI